MVIEAEREEIVTVAFGGKVELEWSMEIRGD